MFDPKAFAKLFRSENDGMLMEFATGLKEYCIGRACEDCIFHKYGYDYEESYCDINGLPIDWRV